MRKLSSQFMADLRNPDGLLHPILKRVQQDNTLMLAIRENYINIYYRGGNLLKITELTSGGYVANIDPNYSHKEIILLELPTRLYQIEDTNHWVGEFQVLKGIMDHWFYRNHRLEREYQQTVVRDNNYSGKRRSDYVITDIELRIRELDAELDAEYDMTCIRRQPKADSALRYRPAFIEMKYGDNSLKDDETHNSAGILKHMRDLDKLLAKPELRVNVFDTISSQFNQLKDLDLIHNNSFDEIEQLVFDRSVKPEVIFLFANHNPRSPTLQEIIAHPSLDIYSESPHYDLRFFVSRFAGYAMYTKYMLTLKQFRKLLED